jgi:hypothetical protein
MRALGVFGLAFLVAPLAVLPMSLAEAQVAAAVRPAHRVAEADLLLPWAEQIRVREGWLRARHEMLLPMMRRHGIGMWVVVNEEFHDDPVVQYIAPPRPYTGNRDLFVFVDAGDEGLKKFAITGYTEETLTRFFDAPSDEPRPPAQALREIYGRYSPRTVGLGIRGRRGQTRALGYDAYRFIAETLGEDAEKTFVSAGELIEEYLDTRMPEEMPPVLRSPVHSSRRCAAVPWAGASRSSSTPWRWMRCAMKRGGSAGSPSTSSAKAAVTASVPSMPARWS